MDKSKLGIYVFRKGTSNKFWSCMPNNDKDDTYLTSWGRYGTRGRSLNVSRWDAMNKISEKIKKGYCLEKSYEYIIGGGIALEEKAVLRAMFIDNTGLLDTEENRNKVEADNNVGSESENINEAPVRTIVRKRL